MRIPVLALIGLVASILRVQADSIPIPLPEVPGGELMQNAAENGGDTGLVGLFNRAVPSPLNEAGRRKLEKALNDYRAATGHDGMIYFSVTAEEGALGINMINREDLVIEGIGLNRPEIAEQIAENLEAPAMGGTPSGSQKTLYYTFARSASGEANWSMEAPMGEAIMGAMVSRVLERRLTERKIQGIKNARQQLKSSIDQIESAAQASLNLSADQLKQIREDNWIVTWSDALLTSERASSDLLAHTQAMVEYTKNPAVHSAEHPDHTDIHHPPDSSNPGTTTVPVHPMPDVKPAPPPPELPPRPPANPPGGASGLGPQT